MMWRHAFENCFSCLYRFVGDYLIKQWGDYSVIKLGPKYFHNILIKEAKNDLTHLNERQTYSEEAEQTKHEAVDLEIRVKQPQTKKSWHDPEPGRDKEWVLT